MFAAYTFAALLALAAPMVARADVTPTEPAPGEVFTTGQTCHVAWNGDTVSTTPVWKGMAIELMSGSNLDMIHITTVATNQDGTVDGTFDYPCPNVTPNSPIYFYQFTAPQSPNTTWTGRFTIAPTSGATTPAANLTQPGSNDPIPWGVGALVDPSTAVAAPSFGTTGTTGSTTATGTSAQVPTSPAPVYTTPTLTKVSTTPPATTNAVTTVAGNSTTGNGNTTTTTTDTKGSGVAALSLGSVHVWLSATALVLAASVW